MTVTVAAAIEYAPKVWALLVKLFGIIKTGTPASIDEEIAALEAARPRPSADIIADADAKKE
jgi:hypothetical protein